MRNLLLIMLAAQCMVSYAQSGGADTSRIWDQLLAITQTEQFRHFKNNEQLDQTAEYIYNEFSKYTPHVQLQVFSPDTTPYANVMATFGPDTGKLIVIGAHYDVCGEQQGADDNASGVVGLLELARILKGQKLKYPVQLVAYTLEEPPFFRTEYMGSHVHAKSLIGDKTDVYGMVSMEMIGYFRDDRKSQEYPLGILSMFYGNKGDYITLVKKFGSGKFARRFGRKFKKAKTIKTKTFKGPKKLPGIDFSDHLNYWKYGYSALMVTDTAFYRNKNYHKPTDTVETLDIQRMAAVLDATFYAIVNMK